MRSIALVFVLSCAALAQTAPDASAPGQSNKNLPRHEEQLVVTGTYDTVPLEETDRAVSTIQVEQSPVSYRNWVDVLEQDPSLDVQQRAPGTSADLSIRGATFGESLILVNGLRLNDVQTGHNNLDLPFPFQSVQRVEVLKGSGSTMYGSDAMGGAVNFITAIPDRSEIRLGAGIGNWGTNQQNGALTLVRKQFGEQLSFVRELSTGFITNRDYRNLAIASETGINTRLGRSDILLGISDRPYGAQGFYGPYPSWERGKGWLAAWTQPIGTQTSADFAYRRHTDEFILFRANPSIYENNHISTDYQAAVRRYEKIRENVRVYYGVEGLREHIDSTNLGTHTRDQGSVYASFDARALRRFSSNLGAREEIYTGGRQVFSPSVSGSYWATSRVKLRASASHAFRLPTYTELYYTDPVDLGNPNLKPESAWSYEGGVQLLIKRGVVVEAGIFNRRDRDVIDYVRSDPSLPYRAENIQNLNFTGAEISLRWQLPRQQRIELSYTGLHGRAATLNGLQSKYAFNYPINAGVATWRGRIPGGFDSRFRVAALQRRVTNPANLQLYDSATYPLVEWTVGREFRHVTPYVQLTNLTDTKYQEIPGVPMPGRGVIAGIELRWKAESPRN
jgi:iron complex outermembrane receptor protein